MEESSESASSPPPLPPPLPPVPPIRKGKSCKGCLYYSSVLKSKARHPVCVGISRSIPQVPDYIVGESELEAAKEGRNLSDFRYACVGYSLFLEKNKEDSPDRKENQAELPFCVGVEVLLDRKPSSQHVPAHSHKEEARSRTPEQQPKRPGLISGEDFVGKFWRNAGLVASGVAANLNKVGNYVKETVDDMLYPYRKRPK
ncbi:altered inheritance of mitochondria protein [Rhynchospora pubera]|uniref:Altered inheritance of mitochondria protein n=1 Tax=Rhynchospora pubera TaxID=906938 RepID=A0AAV8EEA0_9POAL|nr:altered inheritance of mitochondria protein [Rhynchospora pubera]